MRCVEVPQLGLVDGCVTYSANNQCSECESGKVLTTQNTCITVSSPISGCDVYRSTGLCEKCQIGSILSFDLKTCEEPVAISNCAAYSKIKCEQCKAGFMRNDNNYLLKIFGFRNKRRTRQLEKRLVMQAQKKLLPVHEACQRLDIDNCLLYSSPTECAKCNPGYFLSQQVCVKYPRERILDCERYSSLKVCIQCADGMHLKTDTECTLNESVQNCVIYDSTARQTTCKQCAQSHYLSEFNVCSPRTTASDIQNCISLDLQLEACTECAPNFTLTGDRKKCLQIVPNCKIYQDSDASEQQLSCLTCIEGFYYDQETQTCKEGTVSKCVRYARVSNTCEECENRHYLSGGLCKTHEDLVYCDNYSQFKKNSCGFCNDKTVLFFRLNTCLPVEYINHCEKYDTQTTCEVCQDGYQLSAQKTCERIPSQEFCQQKNGTNCVKCLENFVLQDGKCKTSLLHITRNCENHTLDGLKNYSQLKCNYCAENSIPVNYKNSFVCFENEYAISQLNFQPDPKCLKYKQFSDGTYKCVGCDKNFLLLDGTCINGPFCPPQYTLRLQVIQQLDVDSNGSFDSFYVEKIKECGPKILNCKVAAPDLVQDLTNVRYSCVECDDDKLAVISFTKNQVLMRPPRFEGEETFSPLNFAPAKICKDRATETVLGRINQDNEIEKCEFYVGLPGFGSGCARCAHAHHGRVLDLIHKCLFYSSLTTCTQCEENFYPAFPYLCKRVDPVLHCQKYDSSDSVTKGECRECEKEFYLDNKKCVQRNTFVAKCKEYIPDGQTCKQCIEDHFLFGGSCFKKIHGCDKYTDGNTCELCENGKYIMGNRCYTGKVTNCETYEQGPGKVNVCKVCQNTFYLKSNTCQSQTAITNCDKFSQEMGYCNRCNSGNLLFLKQKQCTAVVAVANCLEYKTKESCLRCADGFYPVNYGQRCLTIPADKHCLIWGSLSPATNYDENNCLKCEAGYLLINKQCRNWFGAYKKDCLEAVEGPVGQMSEYKCKYCKDQTEPIDLKTKGLCLEKELIQSYPSVKFIDKCLRYDYNTNALKCTECESGFYLKDGVECITKEKCITNANHVPVVARVDESADNEIKLISGAACIVPASKVSTATNCIYAPSPKANFLGGAGEFSYGCIECFKGYAPYLDTANAAKRFAYIPGQSNPNTTVPVFDTCIKPIDEIVQGQTGTRNEIPHCAVYSKYGNDTGYYCLACKSGYRGQVQPGPTPGDVTTYSHLYSFIKECLQYTDCDSTNYQQLAVSPQKYLDAAYLNGFDMGLLFGGCEKCSSATKILTAFVTVNTDDTTTYEKIRGPGAIIAATPILADAAGAGTGFSYDCLDFTGGTYTLGASANLIYVANCMKQIVNIARVSETAGLTPAVATTFDTACVQCKPGFKAARSPTSNATFNGQELIISCTAIANCANGSTWANACSACDTNYVYSYETTKKEVLFDTCIQSTVANCYSATASGCVLCKKGYLIDSNTGTCYQELPPYCTSYNPFIDTNLTKNFLRYGLAVLKTEGGCGICDAKYVPVKNADDFLEAVGFEKIKKVCVAKTNAVALTGNIPNCNNSYKNNLRSEYTAPNQLTVDCVTCNANYINTEDGQCTLAANNPNCLRAQSSSVNYCTKCTDDTFQSVAGVCTLKTEMDQNCAEFADSSFKTGALCKRCNDEFYLVTETIEATVRTSCVAYNGPIQNCSQFDSTNLDRLFCIKCKTDYALVILEGDEVGGKQGYNRLCIDISAQRQTNCSSFNVSAQSNGQLVCEKCEQNFFLESLSDSYNTCVDVLARIPNCAKVHVDEALEQQYQNVTFKYNYFPRKSSLKCLECTSDFFLQSNTNSCAQRTRTQAGTYDNQCQEFELLDDYCKKCKINYFLSSDKLRCVPAPINTVSPGSIFSCTKMDTCNEDVIYQGLNPHLDALLSCHKCKKPDQIPFIALSGKIPYETIKGLNEYDLRDGNTNYTSQEGGRSNFCASPVASSFNLDANKFAFPDNCAIGVLNVDTPAAPDASNANLTANVDLNKIQVFCAACKPGFKFVPATTAANAVVPYMAGSCTPISNCQYSIAFNHCTQCNKNFSFEFSSGKVNYDTCVAVTANPDCFAYDSTNTRCQFCCKGTYLNKDGFCERIQPPKCEYNEFSQREIYTFANLATGLFLNSEGTGCTRCAPGYLALFQPQNYWVCTESPTHYDGLLTATTSYIPNCVNYYVEEEALKCNKCKTNFVPLIQVGRCTPVVSGLSNCLLALSDIHCEVCAEDYVLVNRACVLKSIEHCFEYTYNTESHQQTCVNCEAGYYLDANVCKPGNVNNCFLYETNTVCNKCKPGFHLVKRNDGVSYCYPIDPRLKCAAFDSNEFQKGRIQCNQCESNLFVISQDYTLFYATHCLKFSEKPNCVKYDIKPAIADSSFSCLECTDNFYLKDKDCQVRVQRPTNCIHYNKLADECAECAPGFFVDEQGTICSPYPTGVPHCREYSDEFTCIGCETNYFLSNELCVLVEENDRLENCLYYVGPQLCDDCASGFLNVDGSCQKIQALNCKTVESLIACASCPQGYGFQEENSVKSCVQQQIANCIDFDVNPPYKCTLCQDLFYPDAEGVCQAIKEPITNCIVYQEERVCAKCIDSAALSLDKSKCLINRVVDDQRDHNCADNQIQETYMCNACVDGYLFNDGVCEPCEIGLDQHCRTCDPRNPSLCLLCESGYFMGPSGECTEFIIPKEEEEVVQPTEPEAPSEQQATLILKTFVVMLSIIAFV